MKELELFHKIALQEYAWALVEGKADDSEYVKQKAYERYEWELRKDGAGIGGLSG